MKLSFYTPIAYDWKYAIQSIMSYYDIADEIILALDQDKISWSNKEYEIDNLAFYQEISEMDISNKISIVTGNFHKSKNPQENDTTERNYISSICKEGNYIIGIDSDEILLNSREFEKWFFEFQPKHDINCLWFSVYKKFGAQILVTLPNEITTIGTNLRNSYRKSRFTFTTNIQTPLKVLHFSWGRTREQVLQKLENWTHSQDFDTRKYMEVWDSVTLENYKEKTNLHPLGLKQWWTKLELMDLNKDFNSCFQL